MNQLNETIVTSKVIKVNRNYLANNWKKNIFDQEHV